MLFSLFEINVSSACNRSCRFCPRPAVPQTGPIFLSPALQEKVVRDLQCLRYSGSICLSGFSEPFLLPDLPRFLQRLRSVEQATIIINTNGDLLSPPLLEQIDPWVDRLAISLYDGPQQEQELRELVAKSRFQVMQVEYRDRSSDLRFVNNRGGALPGSSRRVHSICYYPYYCMYLDYTGEVLFCPHNARKLNALGNLSGRSIGDIWEGKGFQEVRAAMSCGRAALDACRDCSVNGQRKGGSEYDHWVEAGGSVSDP